MQVEHRRADDNVHHNHKIGTARFEQGKRRLLLRKKCLLGGAYQRAGSGELHSLVTRIDLVTLAAGLGSAGISFNG